MFSQSIHDNELNFTWVEKTYQPSCSCFGGNIYQPYMMRLGEEMANHSSILPWEIPWILDLIRP